ncbi:MAG: hypothetical protein RLZZ505_692 [Verrucomicrobiota bacterium]|jgi:hypothetical protein
MKIPKMTPEEFEQSAQFVANGLEHKRRALKWLREKAKDAKPEELVSIAFLLGGLK